MTRRIALCLLSLLFLAGGLMPMPATAQSAVQTVTSTPIKHSFDPANLPRSLSQRATALVSSP